MEADAQSLFYGFPAQDGERSLKVAFYHRPGVTTPEHIDRSVADAEIEDITTYLAERVRVPSVAGRHVRSQTCMYTFTPDHDFGVGAHPQHPRVLLAAGFEGHGFKFVPVIGEVLADLADDWDDSPRHRTVRTAPRGSSLLRSVGVDDYIQTRVR